VGSKIFFLKLLRRRRPPCGEVNTKSSGPPLDDLRKIANPESREADELLVEEDGPVPITSDRTTALTVMTIVFHTAFWNRLSVRILV
jgi:hypothetical protein